MKSRTRTVLRKQFVIICIGFFMIMELRNLIQIECTEYFEDKGSSQQIWQKPCNGDTTNEDMLWSTRQQSKYKYSKQDLLDLASRVIYGRTYKQMDNESIIRIRKLRLN